MKQPAGDCDDQAMLCAAMLRALAVPTAFKTIEADPDAPGRYSHVYVVAELEDGRLYPLDCSHGPAPNTEARPTGKSRVWTDMPIYRQSNRGLGEIGTGGFAEEQTLAADSVSSSPSWWQGLITGAASTGETILTRRFGTPDLPKGGYYQTDSKGNVIAFNQPQGATGFTFPGGINAGGPGIGTVLVIVAVVVALILILKGGKDR
jgi:hypothetical protein